MRIIESIYVLSAQVVIPVYRKSYYNVSYEKINLVL